MIESYILEGKYVVEEPNLLMWSTWMAQNEDKRRVGHDVVKGVTISTVFLGIDHNFGSTGSPLLFETMVFDGDFDQCQQRYSTWDEAEKGHKLAVDFISGKLLPTP